MLQGDRCAVATVFWLRAGDGSTVLLSCELGTRSRLPTALSSSSETTTPRRGAARGGEASGEVKGAGVLAESGKKRRGEENVGGCMS